MLINTWPTMLSRQWEAFNEKKQPLLYLAVESALHTPKSETSCCVSYFCLALAKQFTSIIDIIVVISLLYFARLIFPERGPWHQSDSQLIQRKWFWRKFTHEGFHLLNIWYIEKQINMKWVNVNFAGVAKSIFLLKVRYFVILNDGIKSRRMSLHFNDDIQISAFEAL